MKLRNRGVDYSLGGYLFLVPNITGFLLFVFLPVLASLVLSFFSWQILKDKPPTFVGLGNFIKLVQNREFWFYTYNTVFLMLGIPVGMMLSLSLALLLNKGIRFIRVYRMVYFLPTITAGVALLVLWLWIYEPLYGLVNYMLARVGIEGPNWLGGGAKLQFLKDWFGIDPMCYWAKLSLMLMGLWTGVGGYNMILYLAGLQGINPELYEAADVDGASAWQKFKHISWPMLSPTTFFIFIMSLIGGFQGGFQAAYVMTQGGPDGSTTTISFYIFQELYENDHTGYASAIAWFLFLVVFTLTMISWRYGGKVVHYD
ncbi:MAG TPA: sugar ABC transporter permease [Planctomycetota bacterium]|nr:sugar ABC transporter permease [Planctomycetota bacterium]